jgi:F-type H+-transporting ATPase subunit epsilon
MRLEISTPQKSLFEGEVHSVMCPGKDGIFQILDNHAPMITVLTKGRIKYEIPGDATPYFIEIDQGVLQVMENKVTILSR